MLCELFRQFGTDKETWHRYSHVYEWLLADLRDKPDLRLLEVGVREGRSIRAWEKYFPQAEIVGVDIDPECADILFHRASVVIGDSTEPKTFERLGMFDVVIDDGDHHALKQLATFRNVWPRTRSLCVIEDVAFHGRKDQFFLMDKIYSELKRSAETAHPNRIVSHWTIFAGELVAMKRNPDAGGR